MWWHTEKCSDVPAETEKWWKLAGLLPTRYPAAETLIKGLLSEESLFIFLSLEHPAL